MVISKSKIYEEISKFANNEIELSDLFLILGRESGDENELNINSFYDGDEGKLKYLFNLLGLGEYNWERVVKIYASMISRRILSGDLGPEEGAGYVARATRRHDLPEDFHDLDTFLYAASEFPDRPRDAKIFENGIMADARRWASITEY